MNEGTARMYLAIQEAVHEAVEIVGIDGVRRMSWFASSDQAEALSAMRELEAA
ncbi:hypothetical protein Q4F19_16195 [Sphingomonas sp. BIUV-7]|uniref:Uncharacterized protein n=1 Tax=Sphingomonas natans TaxID=3063330 RepID=A0ABT8YDB8_9SPHN|nr:hypothetical protein [Sphingomonas sp. BIUV-7]MDO6415932.1 hypothetical protein [Sphingomonas sp. BIUV-7]